MSFACKGVSICQIKHLLSGKRYDPCAALRSMRSVDLSHVLLQFIKQKIRVNGPITVADFMRMTLSSPAMGYYQQFSPDGRQIFGASGDFVTAPEISQMFGEMIGVWCYYELCCSGCTDDWQLVESGPGTGQLMKDILRTFHCLMRKIFSVHLVEVSDALIAQQERLLCNTSSDFVQGHLYVKCNTTKCGIPIYWYRSVDELPARFSIFLANEFLDALPTHQFQRDKKGRWHEIYVGMNDKNSLCFMLSKGENLHTIGLIPPRIRHEEKRKIWEVSPEAGTYVNQVVERITKYGGISLIIDYGHDGHRSTHSVRAYKGHKIIDPLENPGNQDITADVDFGYLRSIIEDRAIVFGPLEQKRFLEYMGIDVRLNRLLELTTGSGTRKDLLDSYRFLMSDDGMGSRFKVMSIFPRTLRKILLTRQGPSGFDRTSSIAILKNIESSSPSDKDV